MTDKMEIFDDQWIDELMAEIDKVCQKFNDLLIDACIEVSTNARWGNPKTPEKLVEYALDYLEIPDLGLMRD